MWIFGKKYLAQLVLACALLGGATGLFFGPPAAVLQPIGSIYIFLLEMPVYVFVVSSLVHGLGRLETASALRLLRSALPVFAVLWVVVIGLILLLDQAIPASGPPTVLEPGRADPLQQFVDAVVPANPLADITRNAVPAVVVFGIVFGIAIQRVPNKASLLESLDALRSASQIIWGWVARFAPIGVFALFESFAGTIDFSALGAYAVYILVFTFGCLATAFVVLPALIAAVVPVRYGEILRALQPAFAISFATSTPIACVPIVVAAALAFLEKTAEARGVEKDGLDREIVGTTIAVSYPLAQTGNLFLLVFVAFAAYYFDLVVPAVTAALMPIVVILSTVGPPIATVDAIGFIGSWIGAEADLQTIYVDLMTITRYPQVLLTTAGIAFVTIVTPFLYHGLHRIAWPRLAITLVAAPALFLAFAVALRGQEGAILPVHPRPYETFTLDPAVRDRVAAVVHRPSATGAGPTPPARGASADAATVDRVRATGTIRVGYAVDAVPFSYFNRSGELVGLDIDLVYGLAAAGGLALEFWPIEDYDAIPDLLGEGGIDVAVGGLYVTAERLTRVSASSSTLDGTLALLAPADRAATFLERPDPARSAALTVASLDSDVLRAAARAAFPGARIDTVESYGALPDRRADVAIWTIYQAEAFARSTPGFTAVKARWLGPPLQIAFLFPQDTPSFQRYVDEWLALRKADGVFARYTSYWLDGRPRTGSGPRWSIMRNVLGWSD